MLDNQPREYVQPTLASSFELLSMMDEQFVSIQI